MSTETALKTAILLMGIQASGKSTFYEERFVQTHIRISLDELHTRNKERLLLEECIANGASFVVDNTNPTASDRARYIEPAKAAGYHITGIFFKSVLAECMARNKSRTGKGRIPEVALAATSNKLEMPAWQEGFDELYYAYIEGGEFILEEWREPGEIREIYELKFRLLNTCFTQ
ncbi:MAG: AAA family ATPase [Bacillota bacterium]